MEVQLTVKPPVKVVCNFHHPTEEITSAISLEGHREECEQTDGMKSIVDDIRSLIDQGKTPMALVFWLPVRPHGRIGWDKSILASGVPAKFGINMKNPDEEVVKKYLNVMVQGAHRLKGRDLLFAEFFPLLQ